eukprot:jgi/Hompol1/4327/HPOL_007048-RA
MKVYRGGQSSEYKGERTSESIVSTLKRYLLPAVSDLTAETVEEFSQSARVVVIGVFGKKADEEKKVFTEIANSLRDNFVFGAVADAKAIKSHKVSSPGIVLFKQFDEGSVVYTGEFDAVEIAKFINEQSVPIMGEITPENYEIYSNRGLPIGFYFYDGTEKRSENSDVLEAVAKKFFGKISFAYINAAEYGSHAGNLALELKWPALAIQDGPKNFPYDQTKEFTVKDLTAYVEGILDGSIEPVVKSDPIPESQEGPVITVVGKTFESIVQDKSKDVFIEIYAPWC